MNWIDHKLTSCHGRMNHDSEKANLLSEDEGDFTKHFRVIEVHESAGNGEREGERRIRWTLEDDDQQVLLSWPKQNAPVAGQSPPSPQNIGSARLSYCRSQPSPGCVNGRLQSANGKMHPPSGLRPMTKWNFLLLGQNYGTLFVHD